MLDKFLHPGALNRRSTPRSDVGEHVAFLHARCDESVELKLRILTRCADPRVPKKP
jgi:hypothetical protein